MAPDPGHITTVGCRFEKFIPDVDHQSKIRSAVLRVHKSTILTTELLNLHVRRCLEERGGNGRRRSRR